MNFIKRYLIAVIAIMSIVACSTSEEPIVTREKSEEKTELKSVPVSFSISDNETRAMSYSGLKINFPKKDLYVRIGTRIGEKVNVETVVFKYENGAHSYDGEINLPPHKESELSNVEIAAFLMGEKGEKDEPYKYATSSGKEKIIVNSNSPKYAVAGTLNDAEINIPSFAEWERLEYSTLEKKFKQKPLNFKTAGAIVAVGFKNVGKTDGIYLKEIKIESNVLTNYWSFSFDNNSLASSIKNYSSEIPTEARRIHSNYLIKDVDYEYVNVDKFSQKRYYIWLAPVSTSYYPKDTKLKVVYGRKGKSKTKEIDYIVKNSLELSSRIKINFEGNVPEEQPTYTPPTYTPPTYTPPTPPKPHIHADNIYIGSNPPSRLNPAIGSPWVAGSGNEKEGIGNAIDPSLRKPKRGINPFTGLPWGRGESNGGSDKD